MTDEAAFSEFYRANYAGLVAEMYAYTGSMAEAQEVAQEAFVRTWSRWGRVQSYDQPRAWVARVAYRLAVSQWRKARSSLLGWRRHGPPPDVPAPGEASVALVAALAQVSDAQRRALVLHHMAGYSVAEVAAMEGVAEGTVKARLARGRQRLAGLLADDETDKEGSRYA